MDYDDINLEILRSRNLISDDSVFPEGLVILDNVVDYSVSNYIASIRFYDDGIVALTPLDPNSVWWRDFKTES